MQVVDFHSEASQGHICLGLLKYIRQKAFSHNFVLCFFEGPHSTAVVFFHSVCMRAMNATQQLNVKTIHSLFLLFSQAPLGACKPRHEAKNAN